MLFSFPGIRVDRLGLVLDYRQFFIYNIGWNLRPFVFAQTCSFRLVGISIDGSLLTNEACSCAILSFIFAKNKEN